MLSYRHAFHAGNHADVLKHMLLVELIRYLEQKEKPFWVIDTHAGAGVYALDQGYATKLSEFETGISRLWGHENLPGPLAAYVELVRELNPDGKLRLYPGSPWLAYKTMRRQDSLRLFELHSSDSRLLQENFAETGRRVVISSTDGFAGLKSVLPPQPRRGLVLIDPSYELRDDYRHVRQALQDAMARFATGTYAIWYPQLSRNESQQFPDKLKQLAGKNWLHVALSVHTPGGLGMHGSGMFVINPPWTLHQTLQQVMPFLVSTLGQDNGAGYVLEHETD